MMATSVSKQLALCSEPGWTSHQDFQFNCCNMSDSKAKNQCKTVTGILLPSEESKLRNFTIASMKPFPQH